MAAQPNRGTSHRTDADVAEALGEVFGSRAWAAAYQADDGRVAIAQPRGQHPAEAPQLLADALGTLTHPGRES